MIAARQVRAYGRDQIDVAFGERRFIEDGGVPSDAGVVDKTWRYVNKKGEPYSASCVRSMLGRVSSVNGVDLRRCH